MKKLLLFFALILSTSAFPQLFQGPEAGSVSTGAAISTDAFTTDAPVNIEPAPVRNKIPFEYPQNSGELYKSLSLSSNIQIDESVTGVQATDIDSSLLLKSFEGIPQTNSIPPDPYIAAGPNHLIAVVNSSFRIYDKSGNILKTIDANRWYNNVVPSVGAFDPKVIYDHFDQRWVMVWLDQNDDDKRSNILISVSDDSDPLGDWYNWATKGNVNGSTQVDNWSDYQGVGFDKDALFITANQWSFGGEYQYSKIRIIDKSLLYSNSPGQLSWQDIWNIKTAHPNGANSFGIRPARIYGDPGEFYFLSRSPYNPGTYFIVHKLTNALTTPSISSTQINVAQYTSSELADQLGGSKILIESGGAQLRCEPVYRDGFLYVVHAVKSGSEGKFGSLRFLSFDLTSSSVFDDITIGADGYWYYYPAIEVDKDHNVILTYSRSGYSEYPGAFYMYKSVNSTQFKGSRLLRRGFGNYVKDFDSERNRWGDYMGIWLDPADEVTLWVFTEFSSARDTWGTWIGKIQARPFQKAYLAKSDSLLDFGDNHIETTSDTARIIIKNYGYEDLQISGISKNTDDFQLLDLPLFPLTLKTFDSLVVSVTFRTSDLGQISDSILIQSNSSYKPQSYISVKGFGYIINAAEKGVIYASTGVAGGGNILTIDPVTGTGTAIGKTGFTALSAITINPKFQHIYGIYPATGNTQIIRANAALGDAYEVLTVPLDLSAAAYDNTGSLYVVSKTNRLYSINDVTGDSTLIAQLGIPVQSITINPSDGQIWASVNSSSTVKDHIYKINKSNGDTVLVGRTGLNKVLNALTFDNSGNLFGTTGTSLQVSTLVKIDPATAAATTVGPTGFKGITGLAAANMTTDVADNSSKLIPSEFALKQNYPNPFNPNTVIEYSLPFEGSIRLAVYNLVGEEVKVLQSGNVKAGYHKVNWDATDSRGKKLSSGIYLYRITASAQGKEFKDSKKMILLK